MKMYILVRDSISLGFAMTAVGHAVAAACLEWEKDKGFIEWHETSFKKVVCRVNDKEFDMAQEIADNIVMTESALDGGTYTAVVLKPRKDDEWPKQAKYWRLYK